MRRQSLDELSSRPWILALLATLLLIVVVARMGSAW